MLLMRHLYRNYLIYCVYETYVSNNWVTGHNFSKHVKRVKTEKEITNPYNDMHDLANYSRAYSEKIWICMDNDNYSDPLLTGYVGFTMIKGQEYMNGMFNYSKPEYSIADVIMLLQYTEGTGPFSDKTDQDMIILGFDFDNNGEIDIIDVQMFLQSI